MVFHHLTLFIVSLIHTAQIVKHINISYQINLLSRTGSFLICYLEYIAVGLGGVTRCVIMNRTIKSVAILDRAESSYGYTDITSWPLPKPSWLYHHTWTTPPIAKAGLDVIWSHLLFVQEVWHTQKSLAMLSPYLRNWSLYLFSNNFHTLSWPI